MQFTTDDYRALRARVADAGYAHDIEWAQTVGPPASAVDFALEYTYVVCNSGMKQQIARKIYDKIIRVLSHYQESFEWTKLKGDLDNAFGHKGKTQGILYVWAHRDALYRKFMVNYPLPGDFCATARLTAIEFLHSLPWIGDITKFHLAKNLGLNMVKPDRHLVRIAKEQGEENCFVLCERLAAATGDRVGTVDYVLWRAGNLGWL
jgi:hypothetical protein